MSKIDFLAVGDIVIDAFIELQDAEVHCNINNDDCTISMRWGDKIPYKQVNVVNAVGNSPNASVSASRLGLNSSIVTHLGDDQNGKDCIESLKKDGVGTDLVQVQDGFKTNYHYVMSFNAERTILIKHEDYKYDFDEVMNGVEAPSWIYFSSVGEDSLPYHEQIGKYSEAHPETKLAFQPGTFQISLGYEKLKSIYQNCELFFCNKEEAQKILNSKETDIKKILEAMRELGPNIVVITDGPDGAYTFDGEEMWHMPMYPDPAPPVDRTGAGDSFSSTLTSFLAKGMPISEALRRAPINSMSVVQYVGAQEGLLSEEKIEEYLAKAPEDYKPSKIN